MVKLNLTLLDGIQDDIDFCIKLAKEENMIVLPGQLTKQKKESCFLSVLEQKRRDEANLFPLSPPYFPSSLAILENLRCCQNILKDGTTTLVRIPLGQLEVFLAVNLRDPWISQTKSGHQCYKKKGDGTTTTGDIKQDTLPKEKMLVKNNFLYCLICNLASFSEVMLLCCMVNCSAVCLCT